jgi:hypothetical protein
MSTIKLPAFIVHSVYNETLCFCRALSTIKRPTFIVHSVYNETACFCRADCLQWNSLILEMLKHLQISGWFHRVLGVSCVLNEFKFPPTFLG